jgi:type I restriction enzyme S subunit
MNVGSAVPSMTTEVLNKHPILMPSEAALQYFDSVLSSYFGRTEANNSQSKTLTNLRDTLLPKLISGELRILEAEKLAEEALV